MGGGCVNDADNVGSDVMIIVEGVTGGINSLGLWPRACPDPRPVLS